MTFQSKAVKLAMAALAFGAFAQGAYAQNYGVDSWSGAYAGVNAGLATDEFSNMFSDRNFTGGGQVGYRAEFGPAVVGAELQGNYTGGQSFTTGGGSLDQYWSGAAKLKAGVGLGSTLVYGTGGYGVAKLEGGDASTDDAGWKGGFVFGGGVEQKLGGGLSLNLEYNQMRLDDVKSVSSGAAYSDDLVNHSVKAALNYQF